MFTEFFLKYFCDNRFGREFVLAHFTTTWPIPEQRINFMVHTRAEHQMNNWILITLIANQTRVANQIRRWDVAGGVRASYASAQLLDFSIIFLLLFWLKSSHTKYKPENELFSASSFNIGVPAIPRNREPPQHLWSHAHLFQNDIGRHFSVFFQVQAVIGG